MNKLNRSRFITGSLGTLASINFIRSPARAAQFAYKFGTDTALDHPSNTVGKRVFADIAKETGGRVDIALFPNNQLGGASQMLTQVRSGALEFMLIDGVTLGSVADVAAIQGVGFAFKNSQEAFTAFDGDLGAHVQREINAKGLYAYRKIFLNGMRQITSSKASIGAPGDLDGFKIRTPPARMSLDLFKSLGAAPTPMNFNEVYTSLQTHVVDGQENPLAVVFLSRLFEVQKYLSVTNHMWSGYWLIGNDDAWKRLPADAQGVVEKHFAQYAAGQRAEVDHYNVTLQTKLASLGMTVNSPDAAVFKAKLGPFYTRWKAEFGPTAWGLLEKYTGKLA